jgi:hypothetical protein
MFSEPEGPAGPFSEQTPRRAAVRNVGAMAAALLGAFGLQSTAAKGDTRQNRRDREKHHVNTEKHKSGGRDPTGPTGPTVPAGGGGSGSPGPTGPTGPQGPARTFAVTLRQGSQFVVNPGTGNAGSAVCHSGEMAIGRGGVQLYLGSLLPGQLLGA